MTDYMTYFQEKEEAKPLTKPLKGPRRPNGRADRQARAIKTSAPIHTYLGGEVEVVSRRKNKNQLQPEISLRHIGVEVMSMSPESARELAQALMDAIGHTEGGQPS